MSATAPTAVAAAQKKLGREHVETVLDVKIFALDERPLGAVRGSFVRRTIPDRVVVVNHVRLVYRKSVKTKTQPLSGPVEKVWLPPHSCHKPLSLIHLCFKRKPLCFVRKILVFQRKLPFF